MSAGERIKKARLSLGLSQIEIANALGVQSNFLSNIERGAKTPPKKLIELLSSRYKINANWILTGEGDMAIDNTSPKAVPLVKEMENLINEVTFPKFSDIETRLSALESLLKQEKSIPEAAYGSEGPLHTAEAAPGYGEEDEECEEIPYVHSIAAGPPTEIDGDRSEAVEVPSRLLRPGERYYAASIRGGSMTGAGILDGDLVLVRHADVPRDGAIQVVRHRDKVTLKRLREAGGKGWELRYMDGSGKAIVCDTDGYETLGEFVTVLPKSAVPRSR
jgi:SOS-response transcriptional repressor LexA